ncbi:hypothetical protein BDW62DRAFT_213052 [Aspergillus aurantiobrunneus]
MARLFNKIQGLLRPQGEDDSPYSALLDLPLDILWLIFSLLPLESKACLALTCKPLYSAFGFVLNDEHLAWPRPRVLRSVRFRRQSWIWGPRTDFLRLLESDRWLYCSGCLKLHPPTRFPKDSGRIPHRWRLCKLKAHVVDLCPCLAVNFADRMRLIKSLQTGRCSPDLAPSVRQALQPQFTNGKRLFNHSCSVESDIDAVVTLEMTLTLDGDKCLQASTRYHVQWTKDPNAAIYVLSPMFYEPEPVLLCPHIDILAYTRPVPLSQMGRCQHCDTRLQMTERSDDDSYYVMDGDRGISPPGTVALVALMASAALELPKD